MSYEPRGKVKVLSDTMDEEPGKAFWTQAECAHEMAVLPSQVPAWLAAALDNGWFHSGRINGKMVYSRRPIANAQPVHEPAPPAVTALANTPPQVIAPPRQRSLCAGCSRQTCRDDGCVVARGPVQAAADAEVVAEAPATVLTIGGPTAARTAAPADCIPLGMPGYGTVTTVPAPAPASGPRPITMLEDEGGFLCGDPPVGCTVPEPEPESEAVVDAEVEEPDAWISCRTGTILLTGLPLQDDGSILVPAELVAKIRAQLAGSPQP